MTGTKLSPREVLLLKWAEEANEVAEQATALNHAIFKTLRFGEGSRDPIVKGGPTNLEAARTATRKMAVEMIGTLMSALAFHQLHCEDGESPEDAVFRDQITALLGNKERTHHTLFAHAYDASLRAANFIGSQVDISVDEVTAERVSGAHFGAIDYLTPIKEEVAD